VASGKPHGEPLVGHSNPVYDVAFHPNGTLLASVSGDQTVRLWDVPSGQLHGVLSGHTGSVQAVAFSPDGKLLATASDDQTVRLWDGTTGEPHGEPLGGHSDEIWDLAFQSNRNLISASFDHTVRLWDLTFNSWVDVGCRLVHRNLTMEEWERGRTGHAYEKTCPDLPAGEGAPMGAPEAVYPGELWRYVSP
jgi:WD40 repeat protein